MNRTIAILVTAALITLVALLLGGVVPPPTTAPGPSNAVTVGKVSLSATPSSQYVLSGGEMYLDISLAGLAGASKRKLPINLALVIDRSGSMAGQKLEHAKEAARSVVGRLRDGDRIAIVTYGSDVTVLVASTLIDATSRATVTSAIDGIVDRGGTFLSGGLQSGQDELQRHSREGFVNRIVLISDGQANEGVTSLGELAGMTRRALEQGVHVTTMGVGLDFNENVMTAMAEHGGGHYYFIQDTSSMAKIFSSELETLLSTVARNASLRMQLQPGVELVEVYGYTYRREGTTVVIDLPDLYSGLSRKILCKLRLPAGAAGARAVAEVELAFADVESGEQRTVKAGATVALTDDRQRMVESEDQGVMARAEQVNASKNLNEAMEAYGRGDVVRSQALLQAQIRQTERLNATLKSKTLDDTVVRLRRRLSATSAAPSSAAGRSLVKEGKYEAYQLAK
jgi:Ca-activated chloride channel family protein